MEAKLSKKLKGQFALFLEQHPPAKFSTALQRMLMDYMVHQIKVGFDIDFGRLLRSLNDLLDILDEAAGETSP